MTLNAKLTLKKMKLKTVTTSPGVLSGGDAQCVCVYVCVRLMQERVPGCLARDARAAGSVDRHLHHLHLHQCVCSVL